MADTCEALATVTLGSNAASMSFTSISSSYEHLLIQGADECCFCISQCPVIAKCQNIRTMREFRGGSTQSGFDICCRLSAPRA